MVMVMNDLNNKMGHLSGLVIVSTVAGWVSTKEQPTSNFVKILMSIEPPSKMFDF